MKKKNFLITKKKDKYLLNTNSIRNILRKELKKKSHVKFLNIFSFFKKFKHLNLTTSAKIVPLLGCKFNYKIIKLDIKYSKLISKMIFLKFYFNYSYIKNKKFNLLKTIITFKTLRIYLSLPLRGQRTKTNAKTRKKYNIL